MTLEFKGSADGLNGSVADIGRLVDEVEVLSTGFTDDTRIAAVLALGNSVGNLSVQRAENAGATGEVQGSKLTVIEDGVGNHLSITWDELDNILGQASLQQDLMNQPVGGNGRRRRLPDNHITHQSRGTSQVTSDSGEVEGTDGVDETFQRAVFNATEKVSLFALFEK